MKKLMYFLTISSLSLSLISCGQPSSEDGSGAGSSSIATGASTVQAATNSSAKDTSSASSGKNSSSKASEYEGSGLRDNSIQVLTPMADGITVKDNDVAQIDASHADLGYVCVSYTGSNPKVKLRITKSGGTTYTYDLSGGMETFPLSAGDGEYSIVVFENISGTDYSTCLSYTIQVKMTDEFGAFLYPNKYVYFNEDSSAVKKGSSLVEKADTDLAAVGLIYDYVVNNITYDKEHAENLENGYIPDPDTTLSTGKGICLDYASLMACMLRSQGIPTHLEVGYANAAYHAWVSVYITDVGWINGMIEFDGRNWEIMDPTYAANSSEKALKEFIGDNSNYQVKYIY